MFSFFVLVFEIGCCSSDAELVEVGAAAAQ